MIKGLDQGADDYVTKPFKRNELVARIKAQLGYLEDDDLETGEQACPQAMPVLCCCCFCFLFCFLLREPAGGLGVCVWRGEGDGCAGVGLGSCS